MGDVWFDAIAAVSRKGLITPPATVERLNG